MKSGGDRSQKVSETVVSMVHGLGECQIDLHRSFNKINRIHLTRDFITVESYLIDKFRQHLYFYFDQLFLLNNFVESLCKSN